MVLGRRAGFAGAIGEGEHGREGRGIDAARHVLIHRTAATKATMATATTTTTKVVAKAAMRWRGLVSGGSGYLRAGVAEE